MGVYAGPDVSESGLVLALDGANLKSFKGEVTTNLISNPTEEMSRGEFGQYRDLAPIFDSYGLTPYSLSMDIKVNTPGNVFVYMQNGSYSKYSFVGTNVYCTTEYQRFYFQNITPSISTSWQQNTPNDNRAILATYTGYGSGVNPTVKNIQLEQKSYSTLFVNGTRGDTVATGGGWADMSGNGNHGQLVNGVRESSDSLGALVFDGSNDYIDLGTIQTNSANITSICWVYLNNYVSPNSTIGVHVDTGSSGFRLYAGSSFSLGVWMRSSSSVPSISSSQILPLNQWLHVAFTNEGSNGKLYLNGDLLVSSTFSSVPVQVNGPAWISRYSAGGYYLNGKTSMASLYNRALTASEIQQNFNATRGRYGV